MGTLFEGKKKDLKNSLSKLFPKPMSNHFTQQLMCEANLLRNSRQLRAIDLNMDCLNSLCLVYNQICQDNPSIKNYNHRAAKSLALGELVYEAGELYKGGDRGVVRHL